MTEATADFTELLEHVAKVAPERVVTLHGYARDFARILKRRGISAEALPSAGEKATEERED